MSSAVRLNCAASDDSKFASGVVGGMSHPSFACDGTRKHVFTPQDRLDVRAPEPPSQLRLDPGYQCGPGHDVLASLQCLALLAVESPSEFCFELGRLLVIRSRGYVAHRRSLPAAAEGHRPQITTS